STPDTYVTYWDTVGNQAFTEAASDGTESLILFAYVAIAEYDSAMAIEGGYRPFAVDIDAPAGASPEAAVVPAAHQILLHDLPGQAAPLLDAAYVQAIGTISDGQAKEGGIATGEDVADILIGEHADDGFGDAVGYIPPDPPIPGVWIPTLPSPPLGTYLPHMR